MQKQKGITLIALVITIIILLILAGVVLNLTLGENGIIKRAKNSGITYSEAQAREKLELVLLDMQADKATNSEYNENEYLTRKIRENKMEVDEDIVSVDGWKFKIDRTIPQIIENLGQGEIRIPYKKENLLVYLDGSDAPINNIWKDRSGNNNDAVMSGSYTHDAKNKAYHFIGEPGQGKITKFEYREGVTISACIELLTYDPQNWLFIGNGYNGAPNSRPSLGITADCLYGIGGNEGENISRLTYPIYENRRYTVTLTINKSGEGKIYLDGEIVANLNLNTSFPAIPSNDFRIRGYGSSTNTDWINKHLLTCNIHNVLVYDGALLEADVKEIYEIDKNRYPKEENKTELNYKTEDLVVYLDGEDAPINNVWKDRSGNSHDAVMSGEYTYDIANKSYNFTEQEGRGRIPKFNYTKGITISSRIRVTASVNDWVTIGNGYAGAPPSRPTLSFSINAIQMLGGNNAGNSTAYSTLANREYTITMTIDKSGNGKSYINGKLISTANLGTTFPATPSNDFRIRGYGTTSNTESNGNLLPTNIHNVLVYDRELSRR